MDDLTFFQAQNVAVVLYYFISNNSDLKTPGRLNYLDVCDEILFKNLGFKFKNKANRATTYTPLRLMLSQNLKSTGKCTSEYIKRSIEEIESSLMHVLTKGFLEIADCNFPKNQRGRNHLALEVMREVRAILEHFPETSFKEFMKKFMVYDVIE